LPWFVDPLSCCLLPLVNSMHVPPCLSRYCWYHETKTRRTVVRWFLKGSAIRTIKTGSVTAAVQLSLHCQMAIIGHAFSSGEQEDFIDPVQEGKAVWLS
jgi:hypothetical protein